MHPVQRLFAISCALAALTATAAADDQPPPSDGGADQTPAKPREPKAGDFNAGGQVRLPNGPDDAGQFKTFNWVAVDLKGRYYLAKSITVTGVAPLAVKKPDMLMTGEDPRLIGGMTITLDAQLPKLPFAPSTYDTTIGVLVSGGYMREGAMLLSDKDYPKFTGGFEPGLTAGATAKIKLSSLLDFSTVPVFVYQHGRMASLTAVQIPASIVVKLGSVLKLSADAGVFTGDDFAFGGSKGGRIAAGGSLTVKLGPILTHAGAGLASLLTGPAYPTIRDSLYFDLDVKYAK